MKKFAILVTMAALLVSCSESPESVLDKELSSVEKIAHSLAGDDSLSEKREVIKDEIDDMKDLVKDVRSMKSNEEEFIKAHVKLLQHEKLYAPVLAAYEFSAKEKNKELSKELFEYVMLIGEIEAEMAKSCGIKPEEADGVGKMLNMFK